MHRYFARPKNPLRYLLYHFGEFFYCATKDYILYIYFHKTKEELNFEKAAIYFSASLPADQVRRLKSENSRERTIMGSESMKKSEDQTGMIRDWVDPVQRINNEGKRQGKSIQ